MIMTGLARLGADAEVRDLDRGVRGRQRKDMNMERWTSKEEAELQRLIARKRDLEAKCMAPLIALVKREDLQTFGNEDIAGCLAAYADDFRDALEPFDSGVRCAKAEPSNAEITGRQKRSF